MPYAVRQVQRYIDKFLTVLDAKNPDDLSPKEAVYIVDKLIALKIRLMASEGEDFEKMFSDIFTDDKKDLPREGIGKPTRTEGNSNEGQ